MSFQRSADVLVILILGGAGRLYGGIVGAIIYMVARDQFSGINPQYWYFWIGALLVAVVIFLPNGILGGLARLMADWRGRRGRSRHVSAPALSTRGLDKSFGSLVVANDIEINLPQGERYALIGPNGAGKTTLINLMTGMLRPDGGQIFLGDDDITALKPEERVKRGLVRTFQINTLFPHLNALEAVTLAVCERRGDAGTWWRKLPAYGDAIDEAYAILRVAAARRELLPADPRARLRPAAAARDRARARHQAEGAAARRAGGRRAAGRERRAVRGDRRPVAGHRGAVHRARHERRVPVRAAASSSWSAAASWSRARRTRSPPMRACARSISGKRAMAEPLLALEDVRAGYGDAVVLDGISFEVPEQGSLAVLGRNGVGKIDAAAHHHGLHPARPRHHLMARPRHHARWRRTGARSTGSAGWRRSARFSPRSASRRTSRSASRPGRWNLKAVYDLFPRLNERRASRGNHLSGGEQQMLAIARALMTNPALLLLDEPLEGLAPIIVEELTGAIRRMIADEGTAFILVEQHAEVALSLTDDAIVLERGSIVHRARSAELLKDHATLDRLVGLRVAAT